MKYESVLRGAQAALEEKTASLPLAAGRVGALAGKGIATAFGKNTGTALRLLPTAVGGMLGARAGATRPDLEEGTATAGQKARGALVGGTIGALAGHRYGGGEALRAGLARRLPAGVAATPQNIRAASEMLFRSGATSAAKSVQQTGRNLANVAMNPRRAGKTVLRAAYMPITQTMKRPGEAGKAILQTAKSPLGGLALYSTAHGAARDLTTENDPVTGTYRGRGERIGRAAATLGGGLLYGPITLGMRGAAPASIAAQVAGGTLGSIGLSALGSRLGKATDRLTGDTGSTTGDAERGG